MTNKNNEIILAKDLFYKKNYKEALELFKKNNEIYSCGLCCLLLKDEESARKYWNLNKKNCPACEFGLNILDIINLKHKEIPSFFQTRAFLEIYINLFIENNLIEWCENIISSCEFLCEANPESYKFIARALFANGYFDMAIVFCKKSIDLFYSDPEAFLILSECYYLLNKKDEALKYIDKIINIVKDYYPAILFRKILINDMKN